MNDSRRERAVRKDNGKREKWKASKGRSEAGPGKNYSWSKGEKKKMERPLKQWEDALSGGREI